MADCTFRAYGLTMHSSKPFERRTFLTATTATVVAVAAGCEDDKPADTTSDAGNPKEAGAETTATNGNSDTKTSAGSSTNGGSSSTTSGQGSNGTASSSNGPTTRDSTESSGENTADASSSGEGTADGGSSDTVSASESTSDTSSSASTQLSSDETSSVTTTSGDTSSATDSTSGEVETPIDDACFEGGGTDAGTDLDAGPGVLCSTNTFNGDHCHPLVIPESDISTYTDGYLTYVLEDGGTGHTHVLEVTAYQVIDLLPGTTLVRSWEGGDDGHVHECTITCTATWTG